jgi:hypothetical protein
VFELCYVRHATPFCTYQDEYVSGLTSTKGLFVEVDIEGGKDEIHYVGFEDLTAVVTKGSIFWDIRLSMHAVL